MSSKLTNLDSSSTKEGVSSVKNDQPQKSRLTDKLSTALDKSASVTCRKVQKNKEVDVNGLKDTTEKAFDQCGKANFNGLSMALVTQSNSKPRKILTTPAKVSTFSDQPKRRRKGRYQFYDPASKIYSNRPVALPPTFARPPPPAKKTSSTSSPPTVATTTSSKDPVVEITTYYNNKINQLTTERTSLETENSSLETKLKNLQTEYSTTLSLNKAYKQNVDDMRGERDLAEKCCEEETKKRKLVEEELEELKAKIRRLV